MLIKHILLSPHIRGSNPRETPYISTTDPHSATNPKDYGGQQIKIDTNNLQKDINSGVVKNVEIITSNQVRAELQDKLNKAQKRYDANPTEKNRDSLERAKSDLENAKRDGECLIKGTVPCKYIEKIR